MSRVEYSRRYREENRERSLVLGRAYYKRNKEKELMRHRRYNELNKEKLTIRRQSLRAQRRKAILKKLGPQCRICGFNSDERVLQLDHLKNNGTIERRKLKGNDAIYRKILAMTDPNAQREYQILCPTCNAIKEAERRERDETCGLSETEKSSWHHKASEP